MYKITNYPTKKAYGDSFHKILQFLLEMNENSKFLHMHWSRFEWMFARESFEESDLIHFKIFSKNEKIVGLILFEDNPNDFFMVYQDCFKLKKLMVETLIHIPVCENVCIPNDPEMITLLKESNFDEMTHLDDVSVFTLDTFDIPEQKEYDIISLDQDYNLDEIHHVLWKGFNHSDDVIYSDENREMRRIMTSSPHFNKSYAFVAKKDHKYVSFANIWYKKGSTTALVEPVATVPEHRQKGLSKICIYKAIQAVKKDGAKNIYVGSNQIFYKKIGFQELEPAKWFKLNKENT